MPMCAVLSRRRSRNMSPPTTDGHRIRPPRGHRRSEAGAGATVVIVGGGGDSAAAALIADGHRVVGRAADLPSAVEALRRLRPDIVVVESAVDDGSAFTLALALEARFPDVAVVVAASGTDGRERLLTFVRDVTRCRHGECLVRVERELAVGLGGALDTSALACHVLVATSNVGLEDCSVCLLDDESGTWRRFVRQGSGLFEDAPVEREAVEALVAEGGAAALVEGRLVGVVSGRRSEMHLAALSATETTEVAAAHLARAMARVAKERSLAREHVRIERMLEETRVAGQTFADIIDFLPDATFVVDGEGKVIAWNHAVERMTGVRKEDILGRGDRAYATAFWDEPRRIIIDLFDAQDGATEAAYSYVRREGNVLFAEAFVPRLFGGRGADVWVTASLLFDREGKRVGAIESVRDITARKRSERRQETLRGELAASANQWRGTFDAVSTALFVVDTAGIVLRCNRAARDLVGRTWNEIVDHPLTVLGPGEPFRTSAALVSSVVERGMERAEAVAVSEGERTWSAKVARIDRDCIVVSVPEITAVVELQRSLRTREYMAAMGDLIGGVAHEVRNPLFGISSLLDALDGMPETGPLRPFLDGLRRETDRLTDTMKALLEYGRPVSEERAAVPVSLVVSDAFRLCQPLASGSRVDLRCDIPEELPAVPMDRGRMLEAMRNLVENGIQHSPAGGRVLVRAEMPETRDRIELQVRDSGPGFSESDTHRVFEPFFSRRPGGTGLGLSIVERVVAAHGGNVVAETHAEGGGLLRLHLPL